MKKSLAFLAILSVLVLGAVSALSVVPHAHGNDLDHSKHSSCPIYQISIHGFNAVINLFKAIVVLSVISFICFGKKYAPPAVCRQFVLSRAPPVLS